MCLYYVSSVHTSFFAAVFWLSLFCRMCEAAAMAAPLPNAVGAPLLNPICTICQMTLDDTQLLVEAAKTNAEMTGAEISAMIKEKLPWPTRGACCRANLLGKPLCFTEMCGKTMKVEEDALDADELCAVPDSPFFAQWKESMSVPARNMLKSIEALLCSGPIDVFVGANEKLAIRLHRLETPNHLPDGTFASAAVGTVSLTTATGKQLVVRNTTVGYFPCPYDDNMLCIKGLSRAINQKIGFLPNINVVTMPMENITRVTHFSCRTDSFLPAAQQMHRKITQIDLEFKSPKGDFDNLAMVSDLRIPQATISVSEKQKRYRVPVIQWIEVLLGLEDPERLISTLGAPPEGNSMADVQDKWIKDIFMHFVHSRIPDNIDVPIVDIMATAELFLRYNSAMPRQNRPSDKLISHCFISTSDKLVKVQLLLKMMADGFLVSRRYKLPDEKAHFQAVDGCQSLLISEFLISMRSHYSRLLRSLPQRGDVDDNDAVGADRRRACVRAAQKWMGRAKLRSCLRNRLSKVKNCKWEKSPRAFPGNRTYMFLLLPNQCVVCNRHYKKKDIPRRTSRFCWCGAPLPKKPTYYASPVPPFKSVAQQQLLKAVREKSRLMFTDLCSALQSSQASERMDPYTHAKRRSPTKATSDRSFARMAYRDINSNSTSAAVRKLHITDFGFIFGADGHDGNPHARAYFSLGAFLSYFVPPALLERLLAALATQGADDLQAFESPATTLAPDDRILFVNGQPRFHYKSRRVFAVEKVILGLRRSLPCANPYERAALLCITAFQESMNLHLQTTPDRLLRPVRIAPTPDDGKGKTWDEMMEAGQIEFISQVQQIYWNVRDKDAEIREQYRIHVAAEIADELSLSCRSMKMSKHGHNIRSHFSFRQAAASSLYGFQQTNGETTANCVMPDLCVGVVTTDKFKIAQESYPACLTYVVPATAGGANMEDAAAMGWDMQRAPVVAYTDKRVDRKLLNVRIVPKYELEKNGLEPAKFTDEGLIKIGTFVDAEETMVLLENTEASAKEGILPVKAPRHGLIVKSFVNWAKKTIHFVIRCELPESVGDKAAAHCQKFTLSRALINMAAPSIGSRYIMIHPQSIGTRQTPALFADSMRNNVALSRGLDNVCTKFQKSENVECVLNTDIHPSVLYKEAILAQREGMVFDSAVPFYDVFTGESMGVLPALAAYLFRTTAKAPLMQLSGAGNRLEALKTQDRPPSQEDVLKDIERIGNFALAEAGSFLGKNTGCENSLVKVSLCKKCQSLGCDCPLEEQTPEFREPFLTTECMADLMNAAEMWNINIEVTRYKTLAAPYRYKTINEPVSMLQIVDAAQKIKRETKLRGAPATEVQTPGRSKLLLVSEIARVLGCTLQSLYPDVYKPDVQPFREDYHYQLEPHCPDRAVVKKALLKRLRALVEMLQQLKETIVAKDEKLTEMQHPFASAQGQVIWVFAAEMPFQIINLALFAARNHVPVHRLQLEDFETRAFGRVTGQLIPIENGNTGGATYDSWVENHYTFLRLRTVLAQLPLAPAVVAKATEEDIKLFWEADEVSKARMLLGKHLHIAVPKDDEEPEDDISAMFSAAFGHIEKRNELVEKAVAMDLDGSPLSYSRMVLAPSLKVENKSQPKPTLKCKLKQVSFMKDGITGLPVARLVKEHRPKIAYELLKDDPVKQQRAKEYLFTACPQHVFDQWDFDNGKLLPYCDGCGACVRAGEARPEVEFQKLVPAVEPTDRTAVMLQTNERWTADSTGYDEAAALFQKGVDLAVKSIEEVSASVSALDW